MSASPAAKRYCPSCGTLTFDPDQRLCASCGAVLGSVAPVRGTGASSGLDGVVNQYIQERLRDSGEVLTQQIKQELKAQVRRSAATQLHRNGGKAIVYVGVGIAALIVLSAIVSLITGLLLHLLPFALLILVAYSGYVALSRRLRRR